MGRSGRAARGEKVPSKQFNRRRQTQANSVSAGVLMKQLVKHRRLGECEQVLRSQCRLGLEMRIGDDFDKVNLQYLRWKDGPGNANPVTCFELWPTLMGRNRPPWILHALTQISSVSLTTVD